MEFAGYLARNKDYTGFSSLEMAYMYFVEDVLTANDGDWEKTSAQLMDPDSEAFYNRNEFYIRMCSMPLFFVYIKS